MGGETKNEAIGTKFGVFYEAPYIKGTKIMVSSQCMNVSSEDRTDGIVTIYSVQRDHIICSIA